MNETLTIVVSYADATQFAGDEIDGRDRKVRVHWMTDGIPPEVVRAALYRSAIVTGQFLPSGEFQAVSMMVPAEAGAEWNRSEGEPQL